MRWSSAAVAATQSTRRRWAGAIAIEADVTDRDSVVAAAGRVQQELGGADILVNNAGVAVSRPHRVTLNEILVRPTAQAL